MIGLGQTRLFRFGSSALGQSGNTPALLQFTRSQAYLNSKAFEVIGLD